MSNPFAGAVFGIYFRTVAVIVLSNIAFVTELVGGFYLRRVLDETQVGMMKLFFSLYRIMVCALRGVR